MAETAADFLNRFFDRPSGSGVKCNDQETLDLANRIMKDAAEGQSALNSFISDLIKTVANRFDVSEYFSLDHWAREAIDQQMGGSISDQIIDFMINELNQGHISIGVLNILREKYRSEYEILRNQSDCGDDPPPPPGGGATGDAADPYASAIDAQLRRLTDPIILDLDGDGVELISQAESKVAFDMDNDGRAESTGWLHGDDGFLAIDENKNGAIDSIQELIGDQNQSGFSELLQHDSNGDMVLDSSDRSWGSFVVWRDLDQDGKTDAGELISLNDLGIRSIDLDYTTVNFDAEGNLIHEQSTFTWVDGRPAGTIVDAWLETDNVKFSDASVQTGNNTIDSLPDMRGGGDVVSLRESMLTDGALVSLVKTIVSLEDDQLHDIGSLVENILYRWANTTDVSPTSRGEFFDGRSLATLEAFLGTPFLVNGESDPNERAAPFLTQAWDALVQGVTARLLLSSDALKSASEHILYIFKEDTFLIVDDVHPIDLLSEASHNLEERGDFAAFWSAVLPIASILAGDNDIDAGGQDYADRLSVALDEQMLAPFADLLALGISAAPKSGFASGDGIIKLSGAADVLYLGEGRHVVFAGDSDDLVAHVGRNGSASLLDGGSGSDTLEGTTQGDTLDGGEGRDVLAGGLGDDRYVVDDALDQVVEGSSGGRDEVISSVSFVLSKHLEHLTLTGAARVSGTGNEEHNEVAGNAAGNKLSGLGGNDTLDGGAGSDTLFGGTGDDTYIVDDRGDTVVDDGGGADRVVSSVHYRLSAWIERLDLTGAAIYGTGNALNNEIRGNDRANIIDGLDGADYMSGGLGNDTYKVDNESDVVEEFEDGGIDAVIADGNYELSNNVERLTLSGARNTTATGNALDNRLIGNSGDNLLNGRNGADTMSGGAGDDQYFVEDAGDLVLEYAGKGYDVVFSSRGNYTLTANVEHLVLWIDQPGDEAIRHGTGNTLDNAIEGSAGRNSIKGLAGDDWISGAAGADTLDGGDGNDELVGGEGSDRMVGGAGSDRYFVDAAGDRVYEKADVGTDTVLSTISYIMAANVEQLELLNDGGAIDAMGNSLDNYIVGNSSANSINGGAGRDTMEGGDGDDTYTIDSIGDRVIEEWRGGADRIVSSVSFVLSKHLEHLTLTGTAGVSGTGNGEHNEIAGNAAGNKLSGLGGNDTLDGGAGSDTLLGGSGDDTYIVDDRGDTVIDDGGGADRVVSSVHYRLSAWIERLDLTGAAIYGTGNALSNEIRGNDRANIIDGLEGADYMSGGLGNDTYKVDNERDIIEEFEDGGMDAVIADGNYELSDNVERLTLSGARNATAIGNALDNSLIGNSGDNLLNGRNGADTMSGGAGDDEYFVEDAGDLVLEYADKGYDVVFSSLGNYTLTANVENLVLWIDWPGDEAVRNGTGNSLNNSIEGSAGRNFIKGLWGDDWISGAAGADTLDGGDGDDELIGGEGSDRMVGGAGNDSYFVDAAGDRVFESADVGTDTVLSTISYIMAANVEQLELLNDGGAIDAMGNSSDNLIVGNSSANSINGGAGSDTMEGGDGDDTYTVDSVGDRVVEALDGGTDTIRSTVTYRLGMGEDVLRLQGNSSIAGSGNHIDNLIVGNSGNNVLAGGFGCDTLVGGSGADTFTWARVEETAADEWLADVVQGFSAAAGDRIDLSSIDANSHTNRHERLMVVGSEEFSAVGQVRWVQRDDDVLIEINNGGDTRADATIILQGAKFNELGFIV